MATTNEIIRRAQALARAIYAYPVRSDQVALIVRPEEYAAIMADTSLWTRYTRGDLAMDFHLPIAGMGELRLNGILVLPRE